MQAKNVSQEDALLGMLTVVKGPGEVLKLVWMDRGATLEKLYDAAERVDDNVMTIDLDTRGTGPAWAAIAAGGDVEIKFQLGVAMFGREGGNQERGKLDVTYFFWPADKATEFKRVQSPVSLAALVAHELGHALNLGQEDRISWYGDAKRTFELPSGAAQQARAVLNPGQKGKNPLYHDGTEGGSGAHCSYGARRVDTPQTRSGFIWEPRPGVGKLCAMFHARNLKPLDEGFCETCQLLLRRG